MIWVIAAVAAGLFINCYIIALAMLAANREPWAFCPECEQHHRRGHSQVERPDVPFGAICKMRCADCEAWRDIREYEAAKRKGVA